MILVRGTKRLVSVNICSEEVIQLTFWLLSVTWNFRNKGKVSASHFREEKTDGFGAIKAQLPFSEGKYQLLNSWNN